MFAPCVQRLRRRVKSPYVLKYLEGVPVPRRLVDHLAGADLASSPAIDFFATVPRYINSVHEQRLSRLFFHHVLYPAGGARMPYQAVVVRGGRSVRTSTPHYTTSNNSSVTTTTRTTTPRKCDPLAVPASHRVCATHDDNDDGGVRACHVPADVHATDAQWSRADAARRPYFYTPRAAQESTWVDVTRGTYAMATPRVSIWHRSASQQQRNNGDDDSDTREHAVAPSPRRPHRQRADTRSDDRACARLPPRATHDTVLAPLCGVIEQAYTHMLRDTSSSSSSLLASLLVNDSAGLLRATRDVTTHTRGHDSTSSSSSSSRTCRQDRQQQHDTAMHALSLQPLVASDDHDTNGTSSSSMQRRERVLAQLLQRVRRGDASPVYVQLQLPPSAIVRIPVSLSSSTTTTRSSGNNNNSSSSSTAPTNKTAVATPSCVLCRLAGGVEPHVTFAVGTPLQHTCGTATTATATDDADARAMRPFSHITCLARLRPRVSTTTAVACTRTAADRRCHDDADDNNNNNNSSMDSVVYEPWRLGTALDALLPLRARTATERAAPHIATAASDAACVDDNVAATTNTTTTTTATTPPPMYVVGRCDAETYVLPQRELLLRVFVPPATAAMCAAQNRDRLALQAKLGHASAHDVRATVDGSDDDDDDDDNGGVVWHDHMRLTAARLRHGELCNLHAATRASHNNNNSNSNNNNKSAKLTSYDVRALPGDVVYVPRGWGYTVARITGTALIDQYNSAAHTSTNNAHNSSNSNDSSNSHDGDGDEARRHGMQPLQYNTQVGLRTTSTQRAGDNTDSNNNNSSKDDSDGDVSMDVDAFCLVYKPYPVLTRDQARVYIAANYVCHGIDDFYRNGGNAAYHKYE